MNAPAPVARTNGELVADVVAAATAHARAVAAWAAACPDEAIAAAAPLLIVAAATRRHPLSLTESFLLAQLGYWGGVLALSTYRRWKAQPAQPSLRIVR